MKTCASICEYNPLHNGHVAHLNHINKNIKPDITAVFLSGNFTQRGDFAVTDKYTRAIWAIKAGADIVFELPTVFATANAEIFASGGLKLINSLCGDKSICFGAETENTATLIEIAKTMLIETSEFKEILKRELNKGESLVKARATALKETNSQIDEKLLSSPNNILGIEYIKAILKNNYNISVHSLTRIGGDFNDDSLSVKNPSALAIRNAILNNKKSKAKTAMPKFVYNDLPKELPDFSREIIYALNSLDKEYLASLPDCSEGLENKIKGIIKDSYDLNSLIFKLKSKRYTQTRLKRILLSAMLQITDDFQKKCLCSNLYLKVLAVKESKLNCLSSLSNSKYPLITRKSDYSLLKGVAQKCFEKDVFSNDIYNTVTKNKTNEFEMKIVK